MEKRIYVDAAEWWCCGDAFAVGDTVTWYGSSDVWREGLSRAFGTETAASITHALELHEDEEHLERLTGTVSEISAAFCQYAPAPGGSPSFHEPVPGTAVLEPRTRSDWSERAEHPLSFQGYIVTLVGAICSAERLHGASICGRGCGPYRIRTCDAQIKSLPL